MKIKEIFLVYKKLLYKSSAIVAKLISSFPFDFIRCSIVRNFQGNRRSVFREVAWIQQVTPRRDGDVRLDATEFPRFSLESS